jgi:hypothetical protein
VESWLHGFPCFPHPGISTACFSDKSRFSVSSEASQLLIVTDSWLETKAVANSSTYCLLLSGFHIHRFCKKVSD